MDSYLPRFTSSHGQNVRRVSQQQIRRRIVRWCYELSSTSGQWTRRSQRESNLSIATTGSASTSGATPCARPRSSRSCAKTRAWTDRTTPRAESGSITRFSARRPWSKKRAVGRRDATESCFPVRAWDLENTTIWHRGNTYLTSLPLVSGNMYLTSPPLVSVRHHGRVNSVKVEIKFHLECKLRFPSAQLCCDKCI